MGVGDQCYRPAALPPGNRPDSHCTGGWVSSRAGLDGCRKSCPNLDSYSPIASRYTDNAVPAQCN